MTEIKHTEGEKKGIFNLFYAAKPAGELVYTWAGEDKFIIEHTLVEEAFGGKGLGKKLVDAAVEFARENGKKIIPLCPFAKKVMEKEGYEDVV